MIFKTIALLFLIFTAAQAQVGEMTVKLWPDDKQAAYSFSLDDGLNSQVTYGRNVLNSYGFRGSFMVIADHLRETPPGSYRYTAWSVLRELSSEGHEIASHSLNHPDLTQIPAGDIFTPGTAAFEIYRSKEKIDLKIPSSKCVTFAYPLAVSNETVRQLTAGVYESARVAGEISNSSSVSDWSMIYAAAPIFDFPRNNLNDDLPELELHKQFIQNTIQQRGWAVGMFHEIVPQSELQSLINMGLWNPISSEWFNLLCSWLSERSDAGDIWAAPMNQVTQYIKERDTFSSEVISISENEIRINVSDQMNDSLYNYPLTVDVTLPSSWNFVRVLQGSSHSISETIPTGIYSTARIKVIPDGGEVLLRRSAAGEGFDISGNISYYKSNKPVAGVKVILSGEDNFEVYSFSNINGFYSFNLIPPGDYELRCIKEDDLPSVNSTDALLILRQEAGLVVLDEIQSRAADVNNSSTIDSIDAQMILDRFIGKIDRFNINDWLFVPESTNITIVDNHKTVDWITIKAGDVKSSY